MNAQNGNACPGRSARGLERGAAALRLLAAGWLLFACTLLASPVMSAAEPVATAPLYPHTSSTRQTRDLSGIWQFRLDREDAGEAAGWSAGFDGGRPIAVPSSWNELIDDARNYFGSAWYQTEFDVDPDWHDRRVGIRFGSANYRAKVWLNGTLLGEHVGGHLPFEFDISGALRLDGPNRLVVLVENKLLEERVPAAARSTGGTNSFSGFAGFPTVTYDFFPYAGLHRPVLLFATPREYIRDLTVRTDFDGDDGVVEVDVLASGDWSGPVRARIDGVEAKGTLRKGRGTLRLRIPEARAWSPADPHLYQLAVALGEEQRLDEYRLKIGVRTIAVKGDQLLLNGKPIFLTGFGKHEDFPIHGRGLDIPVIVRDFELLKWIGANSFRTSHYPYSDEAMQLADQYGLLVINETPAVSLGFDDPAPVVEARRAQLSRAITELQARDKNHPSVIIWSLANEPGISLTFSNDAEARRKATETGTRFFKPLFEQARKADSTRPVAIVSVGRGPDEWIELGDLVLTNLYYGWYYGGLGQLDTVAEKALSEELERLHARHKKPVMLSEFGADTLPGVHAQPSEMWSEEYQSEMMAMVMGVASRYPWVVGTHPWAFSDFRTSQGILRAGGLNHKGLFTRDRRPKLAAHTLRGIWTQRQTQETK